MKNLKSVLANVGTNVVFECGEIVVVCCVAIMMANVITAGVMRIVDFFTRWKRW